LPQDTITRLIASTKLVTDYCGNVIYQNGSLKEVLTPEGYWQNSVFYYYLKDHQGNTRAVINSSGTVMEYSDYYPDGMRFESSTSNSAALPYRYNGKEIEVMNGLNEYDYGARRRETGIPVWTTIDPLCEKYYNMSSYAYCAGNPINRFDPDGMDWYTSTDSKTVYWQKGNANIDGYTHSETYTQRIDDHTTIEYNQNTPVTMTETVLQSKDFSSQMKADGSGKKEGEEGNCFYQSGKMVEKSGTKSLDSPANGITDPKNEFNYIEYQASQGKSTRLQVDKNGDGKGDHWVSTSSVKTDLQTNTVSSVGFFDPATRFPDKGTNNSFNVGKDNSLTGIPSYNRKYRYHVVQTRKNKN
jgi:RHS repeat-associated protein